MELRIIQIRKQKEMTQASLAEKCLTTQQQIAKIESGNVDPQLSTLKKIAEALNCELVDLFYSKKAFVEEINSLIKRNKINLKKISLAELNSICFIEKRIPPFHPYWEKVLVKNNQLIIKET